MCVSKADRMKRDKKEAKQLYAIYSGEISAFGNRLTSEEYEFFYKAVEELRDRCGAAERAGSVSDGVRDEILGISGEIRERLGEKACTYAYVLIAVKYPSAAPSVEKLIRQI